MRGILSVLLLFLAYSYAQAQVYFYELPESYQMFPRDETNFGYLEVYGGSVETGTVVTILTEALSSDTLAHESQKVEAYGNTFYFKHKVPACLKEYNFRVLFKTDSAEKTLSFTQHLVAGDFFIVDGQSNAECSADADEYPAHDSTYDNPFNRALGGNFSVLAVMDEKGEHPKFTIEDDCYFSRPSSYFFYHSPFGYTGVWPLRLQYELAKATGIPNCVVNGSAGGTSIVQHYASHTPSKPDSLRFESGPYDKPHVMIYDRVYKKLLKRKALNSVKAIFFYQGESDGDIPLDSAKRYGDRFRMLHTSWKADYLSLQKIFVLQINLGCGGSYHNLVREIQRKFPEQFSDVVVMSTVGESLSERASDLCHYTVAGYSHIGQKLAPLVRKYVYGEALDENLILPANIKRAYYTDIDKICLEFDKPVIVQDSCIYTTGIAYMRDHFFDDLELRIELESVYAEGNKVFLVTRGRIPEVPSVTYLPRIYSRASSLYAGPWILNAENPDLGAYAFTNFPVEPYQPEKKVGTFPNPANGYVIFGFPQEASRQIEVYDLGGLLQQSMSCSSIECVMDIHGLHTGVYIVIIRSETEVIRRKLLIQKP